MEPKATKPMRTDSEHAYGGNELKEGWEEERLDSANIYMINQ